MKFSKRELILLIILVFAGLGYCFYQFIYVAQTNELINLETQIVSKKANLEALKANNGKELDYLNKIKDINAEIRSIEKKVPYIKDIPGLIVEIYYMILENNLDSESISFTTVKQDEKFDSFNISFQVTGNKDDVYYFLTDISDFKRELAINSINYTPIGQHYLRTDLSIKVYLFKDENSHLEPSDYDFMEGKYGTFKKLFDIFKESKLKAD